MRLWAKSLRMFNAIRAHGQQSVRRLATRTGLSKSRVHRHTQAMARRNRHPESWWWETADGRGWLIRLVVAALCIFGLTRGVGAETLRAFFGRLRLEAHIGCSPSALRGVMDVLEAVLLETAAAWEPKGGAAGEIRPIIGAVDETFLARLRLVCMDLASGYVLVEEVATDRRYDTWYAVVKARLATLGGGVRSLVSDRAKALLTLAETGLACLSVPDVFHLLHDLTKNSSLAICSRLRHAQQALGHAQERLATCQESPPGSAEVQHARALVAASEAEVKCWQSVRSDYRHHLEPLALILHPWRLLGSTPQTSEEVACQLQAEVAALEPVVERQGLPIKTTALDTVRQPLSGVAALVDVWWQEVWHDVQSQVSLTPRWRGGVAECVLPLMYGQEHLSRTRCPRRKAKLLEALKAVAEAVETHALTQQLAPDGLAGWKAGAAEHARGFQRASSAVEGRNGFLAQLPHNQRGLPKRRSQVWTVLHNFDGRAADGTTPASRFFRYEFPDLFETVLSTIDDWPRSRQHNQALAISA